jgi:hypothetical protein
LIEYGSQEGEGKAGSCFHGFLISLLAAMMMPLGFPFAMTDIVSQNIPSI